MNTEVHILANHAATEKLGRKLAQSYANKPKLILLSGPMGSGKTSLVQAFIGELIKNQSSITSPSYSYVKSYDGPISIIHCDLYRIDHVSELEELGILEYLTDHQSLRLVEWPERAPFLFDLAQLLIELEIIDEHRLAKIINLQVVEGIG